SVQSFESSPILRLHEKYPAKRGYKSSLKLMRISNKGPWRTGARLAPKAVPKGGQFAVPEWGLAGGFRNAAIAGLDSSLFIVRFHQNGMRLVKPPEKIHSLPAP